MKGVADDSQESSSLAVLCGTNRMDLRKKGKSRKGKRLRKNTRTRKMKMHSLDLIGFACSSLINMQNRIKCYRNRWLSLLQSPWYDAERPDSEFPSEELKSCCYVKASLPLLDPWKAHREEPQEDENNSVGVENNDVELNSLKDTMSSFDKRIEERESPEDESSFKNKYPVSTLLAGTKEVKKPSLKIEEKPTEMAGPYKRMSDVKLAKKKTFGFFLYSILLITSAHGSILRATLNSEHTTVWAGQTNAFTCGIDIRDVVHIDWLTNNMTLVSTIPGVTTHLVPAGTETIGILNIDAVEESFHNVSFQCSILLSSGSVILSNAITLRVQGLPSEVYLSGYLNRTTIKLSWNAVPSLDIPNVTPDILFCVNVSNSIGGVIHSECGITNTSYELDAQNFKDIGCGQYSAIVCAVNPVGEKCSSAVSILRRQTKLYIANTAIESLTDTDRKWITIHMLDILCVNITEVQPHQNYTKLNIEPMRIEFMWNDNVILPVYIHDGDLQTMANISTYDIQRTSVEALGDGMIKLTSSFVIQSQALGVFYGIVARRSTGVSKFVLVPREEAVMGTTQIVSEGFYQVVSYDIERDSTISSEWPAYYNNVTVPEIKQSSSSGFQANDNCHLKLTTNSSRIITCNCPKMMTNLIKILTLRGGKAELKSYNSSCGSPTLIPACQNDAITSTVVFLNYEVELETVDAYFHSICYPLTEVTTERDYIYVIRSSATVFRKTTSIIIFLTLLISSINVPERLMDNFEPLF